MHPWREQLKDKSLRLYTGAFQSAAEKMGVPVHDATPDFEKLENWEMPYLEGDAHFGYLGQQVWGESLIHFSRPIIADLLKPKP